VNRETLDVSSVTDNLPTVSFIIACYNEEDIIAEKLKNTLSLDYPMDRMEVLVISDGSTDETVTRAKKTKADNVRVLDRGERTGKTAVQNYGSSLAAGEILVFSDANAFYRPDALRKLIQGFREPRIGGICGEVRFVSSVNKESVAKEEEFYWGYEQFLKRAESRVRSAIGANGAIYAIRKALYEPLPEEIISDLVEPLLLVKNGFSVKYAHDAIAEEEISINYRREYHRKKRIILRSLHGLSFVKELLNPLKYGIFSIQLLSHKLLRWLIPVALIGLFVSNLFLLSSWFFQVLFLAQLVFYALAGIGWIMQKNQISTGPQIFRLPFYFCLVNLAALSALVLYLQGRNIIVWEPQR